MNPSPMRFPKSHHCPVTRKVITMSPRGSEATEPVLNTWPRPDRGDALCGGITKLWIGNGWRRKGQIWTVKSVSIL